MQLDPIEVFDLIQLTRRVGAFQYDPSLGQWFQSWQPMGTSWALLILSEGLYEALPVAIIDYDQLQMIEPSDVTFDGSLSHHTDPDDEIVGWGWDFGDGSESNQETPGNHTTTRYTRC